MIILGLFTWLFAKRSATIQCPRCLGKGHVDNNDINRLGQYLIWLPGACAYCNGAGKVNPVMLSKVAADEAYLTTDLSRAERRRVIRNDKRAMARAKEFEKRINDVNTYIIYLYNVKGMDTFQITEFFMSPAGGGKGRDQTPAKEKEELFDYIRRVIEHEKRD